MKKIINGRRYDTDSARMVTYDRSDVGRRDFRWWEETLYRKQTGEFFLHGEGGPASKYAHAVGMNEWTEGERLMPMSFDEAKAWCEEHMTADEYETLFGRIEEKDDKRTVAFSLTEATIEKIARLAAENGISKSEVVERMFS